MKPNSIILSLLSLLIFSCTDSFTNIGTEIQPTSDAITVGTDTFHVTTENVFIDYMYSKPDSFLLGTFYDVKYGSTKADILAQVKCPIDFAYRVGAIPDSALVVLYYKSWFGDKYSPLDVNIYEMNKKTFDYSGLYPTNLDPSVYTDHDLYQPTNLLAHKVFSARDASKKLTDTTSVIFKLDTAFVRKFIKGASTYTSDFAFTNFFKGLYITTNYGASTMLNISQIDLEYYYHYTYIVPGTSRLDTVNNVVIFPANAEVRQVNRILHPDKDLIKQKLALKDSVNYVSSPANIQTRVNLPLNRMKQRLNTGINGKKLFMNSALLKVEATEIDNTSLAQPIVSYMMLIKESAIYRFFNSNEVFSDTCAVMGTYTSEKNSTTGVYKYYYTFDIASLIDNEIKNTTTPENLSMRLMPVNVEYNSSNVITSVKQQYLLNAVTIRSGKNSYSPMTIKVVYSGF